MQKFSPLTGRLIAAGLVSLCLSPAAEAVTLDELARKLEALEKQNAELTAKVQLLEAQQGRQGELVQQQSAALEQQSQVMDQQVASIAAAREADASGTTVSSYGEIGYTRPTGSGRDAQVDVGRAVIGITHRFDESTRMVGEFEWEHAITSSTDQGEAEVEQLHVAHDINKSVTGKAGLFLMPVGLLNTNHEPTAYYGVFRNFVETAIIPSTWREVGLGLTGTTDNALKWDAGMTTGFDLTKWDPASSEGRESPLRATHGEGQFAKAANLSTYGALNWQGMPGLLLGGFAFTGKIGQETPGFAANNSRLVLFDVHARYQVNKWDLSALYTRATISHADDLNLAFIASATPNPTLIPSLFDGGYVQAAWTAFSNKNYSLSPFMRLERFNTAKAFGSASVAAGASAQPDEQVWTLGTNFRIGEGVVLKADYQRFQEDSKLNRINFGMGYSF